MLRLFCSALLRSSSSFTSSFFSSLDDLFAHLVGSSIIVGQPVFHFFDVRVDFVALLIVVIGHVSHLFVQLNVSHD